MNLAFVLELYQPPTQTFEILNQITKECYVPLAKLLVSEPRPRFTLSITSSLVNLLEYNTMADMVMPPLVSALQTGNVELAHSGAYHSVFPLLSEQEVRRQIALDIDSKQKTFASTTTRGILSPELCYHDRLIPIFKEMGFTWTIINDKLMDQFGISVDDPFIYQVDGLALLMRNSLWSDRIRQPRKDHTYWTGLGFAQAMQQELEYKGQDCYKIIMLPGETFGHHIKYFQETFLRDLLYALADFPDIQLCTISDLLTNKRFPKINKAPLQDSDFDFTYFPPCSISTWPDDWERGDPYAHFCTRGNPIHEKLWQLTNIILQVTERLDFSDHAHIHLRELLDRAFYSGQYFHGSYWFWDRERVLEGIDQQMRALYEYSRIMGDKSALRNGQILYTELMWEVQLRDEHDELKRRKR